LNLRDLHEQLEAQKATIKALETQLKEEKKKKEESEQQMIDALLGHGLDQGRIGGRTYFFKNKTRVTIRASHRGEFKRLLIQVGMEGYINELVSQPQIQSFIAELLDTNQELPEGFEECLYIYREPILQSRKT